MAQYRSYITTYFITDSQIVITSQIGENTVADVVARDGSMDANFKTKVAAHRDVALGAPPSSTTPPCTVLTVGRWMRAYAGAAFPTSPTTIQVPAGNTGSLKLRRDAGTYTAKYSQNGGALTTFTDGTNITVANGDTLYFAVASLANQDVFTGYVVDNDTGITLDNISLYNTSP